MSLCPSCRVWAQVPTLVVSLGEERALWMELLRRKEGSRRLPAQEWRQHGSRAKKQRCTWPSPDCLHAALSWLTRPPRIFNYKHQYMSLFLKPL